MASLSERIHARETAGSDSATPTLLPCGCAPMLDSEHAPDCDRNHWPHDGCGDDLVVPGLVEVCRGGPTGDCGRADWHDSHVVSDGSAILILSPFTRRALAGTLPPKVIA